MGYQGNGEGEEQRDIFLRRIEGLVRTCGETVTAIPGLSLYRFEEPMEPERHIQQPGICVIAQGCKRILLNGESFRNDPEHYLLTLLDIPVVTEIVEASGDIPYLALSLKLDLNLISRLLLNGEMPPPPGPSPGNSIAATGMDRPLIKAFIRLLDILDEPEHLPMLAPLAQQEIYYRLLLSDQGNLLRQIALSGSRSNRILQTIEWMKQNYTENITIDFLAAHSHMSPSTFHHHFRKLTAMTPLQYQKWLRLQEARRLMLTGRMDAAHAAFKVGYESPSQFSREYSRLFNAPPSRDIKLLRENLAT